MLGQRADEDLCGPLRLPLSYASHLHERVSASGALARLVSLVCWITSACCACCLSLSTDTVHSCKVCMPSQLLHSHSGACWPSVSGKMKGSHQHSSSDQMADCLSRCTCMRPSRCDVGPQNKGRHGRLRQPSRASRHFIQMTTSLGDDSHRGRAAEAPGGSSCQSQLWRAAASCARAAGGRTAPPQHR